MAFDDAHLRVDRHERWSVAVRARLDGLFLPDADAADIPLGLVRPGKEEPAGSVANALRIMAESERGAGGRRLPVDLVSNPDGTYTVADGNATSIALARMGLGFVRARVVGENTGTALGNSGLAVRPYLKDGVPVRTGGLDGLDAEAAGGKACREAEENKPLLETLVGSVAGLCGGKPSMRAGLKERGRILWKASEEYGGDVSRVVDIAGATIAFADDADFTDALHALERCLPEGAGVVRVKPFGFDGNDYKDVKVSVRFPNGGVGEVVLVSESMLDAKKRRGGHKVYEIARVLDAARRAGRKVEGNADALDLLTEAVYSRGLGDLTSLRARMNAKASSSEHLYSSINAQGIDRSTAGDVFPTVKSSSLSDQYSNSSFSSWQATPASLLSQYPIISSPNYLDFFDGLKEMAVSSVSRLLAETPCPLSASDAGIVASRLPGLSTVIPPPSDSAADALRPTLAYPEASSPPTQASIPRAGGYAQTKTDESQGENIEAPDGAARWSVRSRAVGTDSLPERLRTVFASSSVAKIESLPEHKPAKYHGDARAATSVVFRLLKSGVVDGIRAALVPGKPLYILPVANKDLGGRVNQIPVAYAERLASLLRGDVWYGFAKAGVANALQAPNTNDRMRDRVRKEYTFEGELPPDGAQIVLCDDTWTSGRTLWTMLDAVLKARPGADIRAITTLASGRYGKTVAPTGSLLTKFWAKAKVPPQTFREIVGNDYTKLTGSEIHAFLLGGRPDADGVLSFFGEDTPSVAGGAGDSGGGALGRAPMPPND